MTASRPYRVAAVVFLTVDHDQAADQLDAENRALIVLQDQIAEGGPVLRAEARNGDELQARVRQVSTINRALRNGDLCIHPSLGPFES